MGPRSADASGRFLNGLASPREDTQTGLLWLRSEDGHMQCLESVGKARLWLAAPRPLEAGLPVIFTEMAPGAATCHLEACGLWGRQPRILGFPSLGVASGFGLSAWWPVWEARLGLPPPWGPRSAWPERAAGG